MSFEIEELETKPEISKKPITSLSQKIVEAFAEKNIKYGSVKIPESKTSSGIARGIGRFLRFNKEYKNIELIGSDAKKRVVYLENTNL